jgi:hypothetical protein
LQTLRWSRHTSPQGSYDPNHVKLAHARHAAQPVEGYLCKLQVVNN